MKRILPFAVLAIIAVAIAVATVIETVSGTDAAKALVYHSWWFIGMWGLLTVSGAVLVFSRKLWRSIMVFLLHASFVVILAGALTTHMTSKNGFVHLREGEASCVFWTKNNAGAANGNAVTFDDIAQSYNGNQLPFFICLDSFRVERDAETGAHADYVSYVQLSKGQHKEKVVISMNKIGRMNGYRIYQTSYDDDERGSIFTINYDPWGTATTYAGYMLLGLSMIGCSLWRKRSSKPERKAAEASSSKSTTVFMALVGTLLASYMVIAIALQPLMPVLRSPMLFVHVGTIVIAYILLVVSMVRRQVLKTAVFFLTAGIFLGAIWANISWGTYWSWDPKESWALITLIVYSIPLHSNSLPWFRSDKHYRIYSVFALLCLLMTYFGVNYFLGGMHSYA